MRTKPADCECRFPKEPNADPGTGHAHGCPTHRRKVIDELRAGILADQTRIDDVNRYLFPRTETTL